MCMKRVVKGVYVWTNETASESVQTSILCVVENPDLLNALEHYHFRLENVVSTQKRLRLM